MRLCESCVWLLMGIAVGIPLVVGGALDTWRTIQTLATLLLVLLILVTHRIRAGERSRFLTGYLAVVLTIVAVQLIRAARWYSYTPGQALYALRPYLWLLAAIPIYYVFLRSRDLDRMLAITADIVLVSLSLRSITWLAKSLLGITLFPDLLYEYGIVWGRSGRQRLDATAMIGVLIPLLAYLWKRRRQTRYLVEMAGVLGYLVLVSQTRMLILGGVGCLLAMAFLARSNRRRKGAGILLILSGILALSAGIPLLLDGMNLSLQDGAIGYRWYEFQYYSSLLTRGRWITGVGILTNSNPKGKRLLYGNLDTQMYLDDLGAFECLVQFGLLALVLYGLLFAFLLFAIRKCSRCGATDSAFYLKGQLFYIATVSVPLNLFGIQRIFSVAVILAIACAMANRAGRKQSCKEPGSGGWPPAL